MSPDRIQRVGLICGWFPEAQRRRGRARPQDLERGLEQLRRTLRIVLVQALADPRLRATLTREKPVPVHPQQRRETEQDPTPWHGPAVQPVGHRRSADPKRTGELDLRHAAPLEGLAQAGTKCGGVVHRESLSTRGSRRGRVPAPACADPKCVLKRAGASGPTRPRPPAPCPDPPTRHSAPLRSPREGAPRGPITDTCGGGTPGRRTSGPERCSNELTLLKRSLASRGFAILLQRVRWRGAQGPELGRQLWMVLGGQVPERGCTSICNRLGCGQVGVPGEPPAVESDNQR